MYGSDWGRMRQQQDTTGTGSGQGLPVTRVAVVVAVLVAGLATMQLVGHGLPWGRAQGAAVGVTGEAMGTVCDGLPRVGVSVANTDVVVDFTNPADGVSIKQAPALLAEHGVDVQFAVQPTAAGPAGRILADGGTGDRTPVVDAGEIARAGGRPSALALPTSMAGSVWFTLACTPR